MRSEDRLSAPILLPSFSSLPAVFPPQVRDFVYITDKAYTREQILAMEAHMLNTLDFRITVPTAFVFLNRGLKAAEADNKLQLFATFIVERCLQEYRMLAHPPSKVAAAGLNIAMRTLLGGDAWSATMAHYAGYSQEALRATIKDAEQVLEAGLVSSLQVRTESSASQMTSLASYHPSAHTITSHPSFIACSSFSCFTRRRCARSICSRASWRWPTFPSRPWNNPTKPQRPTAFV